MYSSTYNGRQSVEIRIRIRENKRSGRKTVPPSISLMRYYYDAEEKRARQVVIGAVPFWADALPSELESILVDEEKREFFEFVADRNAQMRAAAQRYQLARLAENIAMAVKAVEDGVAPADPSRLWEAMDVLARALDRAGYERPKRERGRPSKAEELSADDLLSEWEAMTCEDRLAELPDFSLGGAGRRRTVRQFPAYPYEELVKKAIAPAADLDSSDSEDAGSS